MSDLTLEKDQRSIPRIYAHYHRLLITLLEDLVEDESVRVVWLAGERHVRRPEGEANRYAKALYLLEDVEPYLDLLEELELVQAEGIAHSGAKRPGLLLPELVREVSHVKLVKHESWASSLVMPSFAVGRLVDHLEKTKVNLVAFERYASKEDPKREKLEHELALLQEGLKGLQARADIPLRQRVRTVKHKARVYQPPYPRETEERVQELYIRDVGLLLSGPKILDLKLELPSKRKARNDKVRLVPLVSFGNVAFFDEDAWQIAKLSH